MTALADSHVGPSSRAAAEEEDARAQLYQLLSTLLSQAPEPALLRTLSALTISPGPFGDALTRLARAAAACEAPSIRSEYHDLFIGLGRGELLPYGSYYLTGFLQEKPLAKLRADMARLGIARSSDTSDPEDHAASVLEMMAGLIDGRFGAPADLEAQARFFQRHVASWLPVFFGDLEKVSSSPFYAAIGAVGCAFLDIEAAAFEMV